VGAPSTDGQWRDAAAVSFTVDPGLHVIRVNVTGPAGNGLTIESVSLRSTSVAVVQYAVRRPYTRSALSAATRFPILLLNGRVARTGSTGASAAGACVTRTPGLPAPAACLITAGETTGR
jgi:hypothetical protein